MRNVDIIARARRIARARHAILSMSSSTTVEDPLRPELPFVPKITNIDICSICFSCLSIIALCLMGVFTSIQAATHGENVLRMRACIPTWRGSLSQHHQIHKPAGQLSDPFTNGLIGR